MQAVHLYPCANCNYPQVLNPVPGIVYDELPAEPVGLIETSVITGELQVLCGWCNRHREDW